MIASPNPRPDAPRVAPVRIAGIYLVSCVAWIWLSDLGLNALLGQVPLWAGVAKGSAFVLASAGLLYWLVRREMLKLTGALELLRAVTEGATDAVFVKDRAGKYLMFNGAAVRFVGKPVTEVLGRDDTELFDAGSAALVMAADQRVMESGRVDTTEDDLTAAGVCRTYAITKAPYRDASGAVIGVVGIAHDITDRKRAEHERLAHLRFLESLDRVNRALHGTNDIERMMSDVLDVVLAELACDRAWLVYPCDPDAPTWTVPMERTGPEYPGAGAQGIDIPASSESSRVFAVMSGAAGPVRFGPGSEHSLPADSAAQFSIRSQLVMAIYPLTGKPWLLGIHQCSHPRTWEPEAERLFQEIGRRLADALTSLLAYRDLRASEERYRALVEMAPEAIALVSGGRVAFANAAAARMVGAPEPAALIGLPVNEYIHPDDLAASAARQAAVTRDGRAMPPHDLRMRRLDGSYIDIETCAGPCVVNGAPGIQLIARDVTARKRAAALVDHQNRVLERIASAAPLADVLDEIVRFVEAEIAGTVCSILLLDRDGVRLRIGAAPNLAPEYNAAIDGVVIGPRVGSCGTAAHTRETVNVDDIATDPLWADYKHLALAHGLRACWSVPILGAPRGTAPRAVLGTFAVYARAPGAPDPRFAELIGRAEHLASVAIERDRADRDLRESEERFRTFVDHAADALFLHAHDGTVLDVNRQACVSLGRAHEDLIGRTPADFDPDVTPASMARVTARLEAGETVAFDSRHRRADGSTFPVEVRVRPFTMGGTRYGLGLVRDITERIRAEQALRESEERLRLFVDHVAAPIAMLDHEMRYVHVSRRWFTDYHLGARDLTGLCHYEVFPEIPERWKEVHRRCLTGIVERCAEDRFERADGTVQWLRWEIRPWHRADGAVGGIVMFTEDITARKRMEAQLFEAQKMESVGRLAGGIAHDFNNLLTVINGFSDLILRAMPPTDPNRSALAEVRSAGERAARLTQQLLAYSRKAMIEPKVLDLNELVDESLQLLRRLIGDDIVVATVLQPAPARIRADRGQIEQVVMNLVVNARDAMPTGGRLTAETRTVALGPDDLPDDPDLKPGRYVRFTVTDTGIGMAPEVRANIFEPFYTTKGVGKGTGLGLAVVQGAVKQSGGHIGVTSAIGAGTTFTLLFPVVPDPMAAGPEAPEDPVRGTETVLLVEDDGAVRTITRLSLESYGYTVLAVGGGVDALATVAAHSGGIDFLVTDVVMPGMGGRHLAEELRRRVPGLRVLFMSGYTDDVVLRHGFAASTDAFLQKPFSPEALARKVREMIDREK